MRAATRVARIPPPRALTGLLAPALCNRSEAREIKKVCPPIRIERLQ
jgi:hypothetical protein